MATEKQTDESTDFHTIDEAEAQDLLQHQPDPATINRLEENIKVIGNETRMKILSLVNQQDLCVHDLSGMLNLSQSAVSHQLKQLKNQGILKRKKDGRVVYYSLNREKLREVLDEFEDLILD